MTSLVCKLQACQRPCIVTNPCAAGEVCVLVEAGPPGICREDDPTCTVSTDCSGSRVCGPDGRCEAPCHTDADCPAGARCGNTITCKLDKIAG